MKEILKESTAIAPVPVVMVSCGNMEKANIITVAWTGIANSIPPLVYVSIRKERHSYEIIKNEKEFVINLPNKDLVWETDFCGTKSGKNVDKFCEAHLSKEEASLVKAPLIKECKVNLECKVQSIQRLGSHDLFMAEVVKVHADTSIITDDKIDFEKANLITYLNGNYYLVGNKIADRGICLK